MARPKKNLTDAQRAEVETLAALLSQDQIADYFGINRKTFAAIIERDDEIGEKYRRGKAKAIGQVAKSLIKAALDGDRACMMFYLKTQAGWRETNKVEVTGADGGPITTEEVGPLERINRRIAGIAVRAGAAGDTEQPDG